MPFANLMCVTSYNDFLQKIEENGENDFSKFLMHKEKSPRWFRGQATHKWHLQPSLYRLIDSNNCNNWTNHHWTTLEKEEQNRLNLFRVRNYEFFKFSKPENDYLWMCVMQHYDIKTRMLDWTEKAEFAFYFAVHDYFVEKKKWENSLKYSKKGTFFDFGLPAVWVLLPNELAKRKLPERLKKSGKDFIQDIYNCLEHDFDRLPPTPVLSPYNNSRIRAQSGTFVIFPRTDRGENKKKIFAKKPYLDYLSDAQDYIFEFVILYPDRCMKEMREIGLRYSMFFPEIPIIDQDIEDDLI